MKTTTVRVCLGKDCGRGGKYIKERLESMRGRRPDIVIEEVYCMSYCEKGPNVEIDGSLYHRSSPVQVAKILGGKGGKR